jgi:hypothetical protein
VWTVTANQNYLFVLSAMQGSLAFSNHLLQPADSSRRAGCGFVCHWFLTYYLLLLSNDSWESYRANRDDIFKDYSGGPSAQLIFSEYQNAEVKFLTYQQSSTVRTSSPTHQWALKFHLPKCNLFLFPFGPNLLKCVAKLWTKRVYNPNQWQTNLTLNLQSTESVGEWGFIIHICHMNLAAPSVAMYISYIRQRQMKPAIVRLSAAPGGNCWALSLKSKILLSNFDKLVMSNGLQNNTWKFHRDHPSSFLTNRQAIFGYKS